MISAGNWKKLRPVVCASYSCLLKANRALVYSNCRLDRQWKGLATGAACMLSIMRTTYLLDPNQENRWRKFSATNYLLERNGAQSSNRSLSDSSELGVDSNRRFRSAALTNAGNSLSARTDS